MSAAFFTADHHFGHYGILGYCSTTRGRFSTVDEMDQFMIEKWNAFVRETDTVYHLGDLSFRDARATANILRRLNGKKHLVRGNHDRSHQEVTCWFESVHDYREVKFDGRKLVLSHYPMMTWNGAHRGSWMLHGHSHGSLRAPPTTRLDVGVDARPGGDLSPWSWEEVQSVLGPRMYQSTDHHGE